MGINKRKIRIIYKYQKRNIHFYRIKKQQERDIKEASMTNIKGRVKNNFSGFLRAVVIGILILLQMLIILILPAMLRQYTTLFYFVLELLSFFVALGLTNANKNASFKVAWMAIALLLPISGHIMYYLWGRGNTQTRMIKKTEGQISKTYPYISFDAECEKDFYETHPEVSGISKYLKSFKMPLYRNNKAKYYSMGEDVFEDIFRDILEAKKFILINFFIVAEGALWDMLHEVLLKKVEEGVEVVFIYD